MCLRSKVGAQRLRAPSHCAAVVPRAGVDELRVHAGEHDLSHRTTRSGDLIARVARQAPGEQVELALALLNGHTARSVAVVSDRKRLAHRGVSRDFTLEQQRYQANGPNLASAGKFRPLRPAQVAWRPLLSVS